MKKLLVLILTVVLCLCCLASCGSAHKENTWFSEEKLTECLVGDFPTITKDYVKHNDEDIYVSFTNKEREAYVAEVFEYLKSQNFKYLGTRGEQVSTLAGTFTTYYFKPATELSEFYVGSSYKFVYSDGTLDEDGDLVFCIINIYDYEAKNLEYGTNNFAYNTLITLRYKSEAPLSGRYALNDEEHEHTITYISADAAGHFANYTCGCPHDHGAEPHYDENGDYICDACGYVMPEHEHTGEWMLYNRNSHYYEYTCGCTLPDRIEEHVYDDTYTFCVICGFDLSEMPPLVDETIFLRNLTGCEWLNEIAAEDIAEIKIISEAVGVAPGNLKNISSSTDEAVIARIFEEYNQLDTRPISKMDGQIDGGGGVIAKFILKDGTAKELYINNGNYRDPDDNYFELLYAPNFNDTDNATMAYGFITYIGTGTIYDGDNNLVCEIPVDELEFIITDYDPMLFANGYEYYIDTEFGTLYFAKVDIFASEGGIHELIGADYYFIEEGNTEFCYRLVGKNLDELIAEYSTTTE